MKKMFGLILFIASALSVMFYSCSSNEEQLVQLEISKVQLDYLEKEKLKLTINEELTLKATVYGSVNGDVGLTEMNEPITWASSNNMVATVFNGKVTAKQEGSAIITAKAGNQTATCEITVKDGIKINGYIWAKSNVAAPGQFAAKPEDHGMFYQWNRKTGWSIDNPMINSNGGTTWDPTPQSGDKWEAVNDPSPTGWRVPNDFEIRQLRDGNYVNLEWVTENGVDGMKVTDKVSGNTLFLPAAVGCRMGNGSLSLSGRGSSYWSSTENGSSAFTMMFWKNSADIPGNFRYMGFLVRSVAE